MSDVQTDEAGGAEGRGDVLHTDDLLRSKRDTGGDGGEGGERDQDRAREPSGPPLLGDRTGELRERWEHIQTGFVDEPRGAVEQADALVAEVMRTLAETFAAERRALEQEWAETGDPSTERLRVALQRYRDFFHRLLAA